MVIMEVELLELPSRSLEPSGDKAWVCRDKAMQYPPCRVVCKIVKVRLQNRLIKAVR